MDKNHVALVRVNTQLSPSSRDGGVLVASHSCPSVHNQSEESSKHQPASICLMDLSNSSCSSSSCLSSALVCNSTKAAKDAEQRRKIFVHFFLFKVVVCLLMRVRMFNLNPKK